MLPDDARVLEDDLARRGATQAELVLLGADRDAGIAALEKSVALTPERASFWNVLGMSLGGAGRLAEAVSAFEKALALEPRNHLFAFNLGLALERQGRPAEARRRFAEALALAPDFAPARAKVQVR